MTRKSGETAGHASAGNIDGQLARVRQGFWSKLKQSFTRLPFAEDLLAAYYCAFDPNTPLKVKATLASALGYFIMPIDTIPDVILGLGFTDDAAVLAFAISMVARHILPVHREAAKRTLEDLKGDSGPTA